MRTFALCRALLCAVIVLAFPIFVSATSFVMVADEHLADQADGIVLGTVESVGPGGDRWATEYRVRVERWIGRARTEEVVTVRVPGGFGPDGNYWLVWGMPHFRAAERVFLFVSERDDGTFGILHLMLGAFRVVEGRDETFLVRDLRGSAEVSSGSASSSRFHQPRVLDRFSSWIEMRYLGKRLIPDYFADPSAVPGSTRASFTLFESEGKGIRWFRFDEGGSVDWTIGPGWSVSTDIESATRSAMQAWNDDAETPISYTLNGFSEATGGLAQSDGANTILPGDPNGEVDGTFNCLFGGVLGIGGPWFGLRTRIFDSREYFVTVEADVVLNDGIECAEALSPNAEADLAELLGHELGHTLGIGHSCGDNTFTCPDPVEDEALMRAVQHGDQRGARVNADDLAALHSLYMIAVVEEPNAEFSFDPQRAALVGQRLRFVDRSTGATAWSWEFGDGATSIEQNPVHAYLSTGSYTVTLTITTENAGQLVASRKIEVIDPPSRRRPVKRSGHEKQASAVSPQPSGPR